MSIVDTLSAMHDVGIHKSNGRKSRSIVDVRWLPASKSSLASPVILAVSSPCTLDSVANRHVLAANHRFTLDLGTNHCTQASPADLIILTVNPLCTPPSTGCRTLLAANLHSAPTSDPSLRTLTHVSMEGHSAAHSPKRLLIVRIGASDSMMRHRCGDSSALRPATSEMAITHWGKRQDDSKVAMACNGVAALPSQILASTANKIAVHNPSISTVE
jgi:hypothetical protein